MLVLYVSMCDASQKKQQGWKPYNLVISVEVRNPQSTESENCIAKIWLGKSWLFSIFLQDHLEQLNPQVKKLKLLKST